MSQAHFSIIFEGTSVENGEIDVRDLAPSLLALGDLIQSANDQINGEQARVAVKLNATGKGSVEVFLTIGQQLTDVLDMLGENRDGIAAAKDLAQIIFWAGTGVAGSIGGLFALLKFLKNRKPDKVVPGPSTTEIHIGDNVFISDNRALEIAQNVQVRESAKKMIAVLERQGIDSVSARLDGEKTVEIKKGDVGSFELPAQQEEELMDEMRVMHLQIVDLTFRADGKWKLTDGGEPFFAEIQDADFLNRIAKGEIAFSKNDNLKCRVRERQFRTAKGTLKTERTLIEVIEFKPGARQLQLF